MRDDDAPPESARREIPLGGSEVDVTRELLAVLESRREGAAALATVIGRRGSAPQIVGAKLLMHPSGRFVGTVGGGAIEAQVIEACRAALRDGRSRRVEANLVVDLAMCCGGSMEIFVEYVAPQARLFVIGAGHVAQALAPIAQSAGFAVSVFDDREELLDHPAFAEVTTASLDVDELAEVLEDLSDQDFLLIITRDHARDEKALAALLRRPHRYLGMIGSRRKVHRILSRIHQREAALGRPPPDLSRLRAPIGLDLGGRTPGEIAVSVVAELVMVRHGGGGGALSIVGSIDVEGASDQHPAAASGDDA
ncbi:MAG: XdhC family protein [Myxococcales bacterium]|nr:XdhC family protein [Myxococcales bacterium]